MAVCGWWVEWKSWCCATGTRCGHLDLDVETSPLCLLLQFTPSCFFQFFISTSLVSLAGFVSSGGNTNWRVLVILEPTPDITVHYETRFARSYLIASCRLSFYTLSGCRYFRCSCAITPTRFDIFFPFAKHQHALPTALVPARVGGPGDCPGGQCL